MSALRLCVLARNNFKEKGKRLKWFEVEVEIEVEIEIKVALVDMSLFALSVYVICVATGKHISVEHRNLFNIQFFRVLSIIKNE